MEKIVAKTIRRQIDKDMFTTGTVFFRSDDRGVRGSIVLDKVDPFDRIEKISVGSFILTSEDLKKLEEV